MDMKKRGLSLLVVIVLSLATIVGCADDKDNIGEFTGQEITYQLYSSSDYNHDGHITFKERKDKTVEAEVFLEDTQSGAFHPLHLHYGPLGADGDLATLLNPIDGATGVSKTQFGFLGDESSFTFTDLLNFDGSVKVHLDNGRFKEIVLAGGNIGSNRLNETSIKNCTDFEVTL